MELHWLHSCVTFHLIHRYCIGLDRLRVRTIVRSTYWLSWGVLPSSSYARKLRKFLRVHDRIPRWLLVRPRRHLRRKQNRLPTRRRRHLRLPYSRSSSWRVRQSVLPNGATSRSVPVRGLLLVLELQHYRLPLPTRSHLLRGGSRLRTWKPTNLPRLNTGTSTALRKSYEVFRKTLSST